MYSIVLMMSMSNAPMVTPPTFKAFAQTSCAGTAKTQTGCTGTAKRMPVGNGPTVVRVPLAGHPRGYWLRRFLSPFKSIRNLMLR